MRGQGHGPTRVPVVLLSYHSTSKDGNARGPLHPRKIHKLDNCSSYSGRKNTLVLEVLAGVSQHSSATFTVGTVCLTGSHAANLARGLHSPSSLPASSGLHCCCAQAALVFVLSRIGVRVGPWMRPLDPFAGFCKLASVMYTGDVVCSTP